MREIHHSTHRLDALVDRLYAAHAPAALEEAAEGHLTPECPPHPLSRSLIRAFIFEVRASDPPHACIRTRPPHCDAEWLVGWQVAEYDDVGRCQLIWTAKPHLVQRYGLPQRPAPDVQRLLAAAAARLTHRRQPGGGQVLGEPHALCIP